MIATSDDQIPPPLPVRGSQPNPAKQQLLLNVNVAATSYHTLANTRVWWQCRVNRRRMWELTSGEDGRAIHTRTVLAGVIPALRRVGDRAVLRGISAQRCNAAFIQGSSIKHSDTRLRRVRDVGGGHRHRSTQYGMLAGVSILT